MLKIIKETNYKSNIVLNRPIHRLCRVFTRLNVISDLLYAEILLMTVLIYYIINFALTSNLVYEYIIFIAYVVC